MKLLKRMSCAITATVTAALCLTVPSANLTQYVSAAEDYENFAKALQYSQYFYDANMCGTEVENNTQCKLR